MKALGRSGEIEVGFLERLFPTIFRVPRRLFTSAGGPRYLGDSGSSKRCRDLLVAAALLELELLSGKSVWCQTRARSTASSVVLEDKIKAKLFLQTTPLRNLMSLKPLQEENRSEPRLHEIAVHLSLAKTTPKLTNMGERPFITCHVLDTVVGRPGAGIAVTLETIGKGVDGGDNLVLQWAATTNYDGRVTEWKRGAGDNSADLNVLVETWKKSDLSDQQMVFALKFDVASYYGPQNTFWPEVQLNFFINKDQEHYHVPLLLGPWSYTTYRGS